MKEVVRKFDISVAKVILNPVTMKLYCSLKVAVGVEEGRARVCNFVLSPGHPSKFDVGRVTSTIRRMEKYGKRGYHFENYPILQVYGA